MTKSEASSTYNWIVGFAAGFGGLLFGYEIGVIGQVLAMISFQIQFNLIKLDSTGNPLYGSDGKTIDADNQADLESWITSTFLFGCIIGAAIFSVVCDRLGRKKSIIISGILFAIGGLVQCISSTLGPLLIGRVVSGLAIGTASMVVPMYIAETAPAATRGALTTVYQLMITFGIFVATAINSIIIKASPRWLAEKGLHEQAIQVISKLRGLDVNHREVVAEMKEIQDGVDFDKNLGDSTWGEMFRGSIGKRTIIAIVNQSLQQLTGINVILYYSKDIFNAMGFASADTKIAFPLANAFINFIATFPGMWAVDRFGRKTLLLWGALGMAIGHAGVFTFFQLSKSNQPLAWGAIISVYIFLISFATTWGPVVWSYQAEIFPLRVRSKGTGIGTMTNWIWNTIIAYAFPQVFSALNKGPSVYWIFFSFCAIMFVWSWTMIKETKGLSLEEIGEVFGEEKRDGETGTAKY
ncbi:general substrate transporter [Rhizoclosmatium globosum]|uniref:General substrate transporter n=1 Tax=Rhizoclosmatium globosum TaxID=329046 RepID=A0A1Y2D1K6_9FUNG|nr:general substrate transporter [Rhizoclosmatium globosum]|eukprot:ORY53169.1 general substrate transporter [Rhizoclosmatium globosum]